MKTKKELEMAGILWYQMQLKKLNIKGQIANLSIAEEKIVQGAVDTQVFYARRQAQRQLERRICK